MVSLHAAIFALLVWLLPLLVVGQNRSRSSIKKDFDAAGISPRDSENVDQTLLSNLTLMAEKGIATAEMLPKTSLSNESMARTGAEIAQLLNKHRLRYSPPRLPHFDATKVAVCNCSTQQCDYELVSYLGDRYKNLCLSYNGTCFFLTHKDFHSKDGAYVFEDEYGCAKLGPEHGRPFSMCLSYPGYNVKCCRGDFCTKDYIKLKKPKGFFAANKDIIIIGILTFVCICLFLALYYYQPWKRRSKYCVLFNRWFGNQLRFLMDRIDQSTYGNDAELQSIGTVTTSQPSTANDSLIRMPNCSQSTTPNGMSSRMAPFPQLHRNKEGEPLLLDSDSTLISTTASFSGSGSGGIQLTQKTFSYQISLVRRLSQGSFGEVWQGSWKGEAVAVKIFNSRQQMSWLSELSFYQKYLSKHRNIVGVLGSDRKDLADHIELWIIMEYFPNCSMFEYVEANTLDMRALLRMCCTAANGLHYMHTQIIGYPDGKPAVAHNDLKTKNILVRADLSCCIGDFGLACAYDESAEVWITPKPERLGTIRYVAPELLLGFKSSDRIDTFRQADIYSFALVVYQLACRTEAPGVTPLTFEDSHPYNGLVDHEPSREQMAEVVANKELRPTIPESWLKNESLRDIARIIEECWSKHASGRLSAHLVRKRLESIVGAEEAMSGL
ncbi:hypothetical protein WR25_10185 [Diploscapter pachys]|uniref:receptor protein serine/threonine kinase n=1 Tax=Diploscapter pachys TaxID=2018661 RepID=A0A2A2KM61_9BILA|nr:hypothetical protein WR25_10185 [Diploscapter pachys]